MELKTTILKIGDSFYIRVPPGMVEYFNLKKHDLPVEAKIKDIDNKLAQITFPNR